MTQGAPSEARTATTEAISSALPTRQSGVTDSSHLREADINKRFPGLLKTILKHADNGGQGGALLDVELA